jgi:ATP-dependent 26S proteasome regulatory subunit
MTLKLWSRTEGVTTVPTTPFMKEEPADQKYREFPALFSLISQNQRSLEPSERSKNIWVLRDFHTVVNDPKCQRYIRDLKEYKSLEYNPLIVISPATEIPSDIARLFRVVEYDLPDKDMVADAVAQGNTNLQVFSNRFPDVACHILTEEEMKPVVNACMGLTFKELDMAIKESSVRFKELNLEFLAKNKIDIVKKTGVLDYRIPKLTLDDIGGNAAIKAWLKQEKHAFSDEAAKFGVEKPKGAMYVGVPGAGKSALAEAFANELHVPLLELSMSKIMSKLVGESERKIDQALKIVKACAPCVLLLDEVEKMLGSAGAGGSSNQSDGGVTNRILQSILKFMNDNDSGVYVTMTSNDVSQLPPEFTRAGRLDATWYFGLPSEDERKEIFKIHFAKKNKEVSDIVLNEAVRASQGYTGAEIQQVVKNSILKAFIRSSEDGNMNITAEDIVSAVAEVIPVSQSSREKIAALENYCRTRARMASGIPGESEDNNSQTREDVPDFLLDLG